MVSRDLNYIRKLWGLGIWKSKMCVIGVLGGRGQGCIQEIKCFPDALVVIKHYFF